jgi:subtilisin family serine protease
MNRSKGLRWLRVFYIFMVLVLMIPGGVSASSLYQSRQGDSPAGAVIDPQVITEIDTLGSTTFWVVLRQKANLNAVSHIPDWNERGAFVYQQLTQIAENSQAGLRGLLDKRGAQYRVFWLANAIQVTGDKALLDELAAQPEVEQIAADKTYYIPDPIVGTEEAQVDAIEWNINRINAPLVWSTFNARGEGIVVANIDTGVQFNHPALAAKYRGNLGGGSFDHNYNWFDPSHVCGNPSLVPCDNNGHGTHTMGTMVGDDGASNQIGVAPNAKFIMAKGCETTSCSDAALLASAQWILAPTDLNGQNPRPDLRPNIVNNSWGSSAGGDFWYQASVQAWVAAGIFPAFSNGNAGPGCGTAGSPGDYVESYASGAFDINNVIASFSSRGPADATGITKPNIAAPGVNVRSSVPTNGYAAFNGTSMASPHTAGTVALMWSAAPVLIGDIAQTRTLLNMTAVDTSDLQCGGTAGNNSVWGEGKLDAFAAVSQSPRGATGTLEGVVTDAGSSSPLAGVLIDVTGPVDRSALTDASGAYSFLLSVGTYELTASKFGYLTQVHAGLVVTDGITTTLDVALVAAPNFTLSGTVFDNSNQPVENATVSIIGTTLTALSDANGFYSIPNVPQGTYDVRAVAGLCTNEQILNVSIVADTTLDFNLTLRTDSFGYYCQIVTPAYIEATTLIPLTGDDVSAQVPLPFPFSFYGQTYNAAFVSTNGNLNFLASATTLSNVAIPAAAVPNAAIYAFWDDLFVDASASVRSELLGTAPTRRFVIEWRNVRPFGDTTRRFDFEVVLHENGRILTQYRNINADGREKGNSATLGIENATGTVALQYSFNTATIKDPTDAILYRLPPSGFVEGTVTDANDTAPIAGAVVKALQSGSVIRQTTTNANGFYRVQLPLGAYDIEASASNYGTGSAAVTLVTEDETVVQNFALQTALAVLDPASLLFVVPVDTLESQVLTLSNAGGLDLVWQSQESSDTTWLDESPISGTLPAGGTQPIQVSVNSTGLAPGVYNATILYNTNSGREPVVEVPVTLVVAAYYQRVNAGGPDYTDIVGDIWAADRVYQAGSWGYTSTRSRAGHTSKPIGGTDDDPLYQAYRQDPVEYRFDGLANGIYQIDLLFMEPSARSAGSRMFDVIMENMTVLPAHDIYAEVGRHYADSHTFFVLVTDGTLNIRLVGRRGFAPPVISALRVIHRPDK